MNKPDVVDELSNILSEYNPAFSDGFAQRVMKNIESKKRMPKWNFIIFLDGWHFRELQQ